VGELEEICNGGGGGGMYGVDLGSGEVQREERL